MSLYRRGDTWWIQIKHRGHRIRRSAGTTEKALAQRKHDELKARLWTQKQVGRTADDALKAWLEERPRGASDIRMLRLIRDAYEDRALIEVTATSIADAFADKSPAHYNRLVAIIRAAMNLAATRGWIDRAPKLSKRKVERKSFRWLTHGEWESLYPQLAEHLKPMALFAVATGLRWGNVAGLKWEQVDRRRKQAWIEAGDAKARKAIRVPLNADALAALRLAGTRKGFVFVLDDKPIASAKTGWHLAVKRAKIDAVRWHDLRHTWASWHVQNGTPLAALKELGGWSSLEQVQIYAHMAPSAVARFADNVSVSQGKAA